MFHLKILALRVILLGVVLTIGILLAATHTQQRHLQAGQKVAFHAVICLIERNTLASPVLSAEQKYNRLVGYDKLLVNNIHTAPCGLIPRREP